MTMLEKAARAARLAYRFGSRAEIEPDHPEHERFFRDHPHSGLSSGEAEVIARGVLKAIREPDDAMMAAAHHVGIDMDPRDYWPAMIDAILEEQKS